MKRVAHEYRRTIRSHLLCVGVLGVLGCSGPAQSDLVIMPPPGPPAFDTVNLALGLHCGTLNCHGSEARNMRIYGYYGIRLDDKDRVDFTDTTTAEHEATYKSLISIEPERITQIVKARGSGIGKWVVVSKGRATEHHKGGARMAPGDAMDTCLLSWVVATSIADAGPGTVNTQACTAAGTVLPPGTDWTETPAGP